MTTSSDREKEDTDIALLDISDLLGDSGVIIDAEVKHTFQTDEKLVVYYRRDVKIAPDKPLMFNVRLKCVGTKIYAYKTVYECVFIWDDPYDQSVISTLTSLQSIFQTLSGKDVTLFYKYHDQGCKIYVKMYTYTAQQSIISSSIKEGSTVILKLTIPYLTRGGDFIRYSTSIIAEV